MSGALLMAAAGGEVVSLTTPVNYTGTASAPTLAAAGYELRADGTQWERLLQEGDTEQENWVDPPSAAPGDYEARCTVISGTLSGSSDATDTWLALTSDRLWLVTAQSAVNSASIDVEIRLGTTVLVTVRANLTADSS